MAERVSFPRNDASLLAERESLSCTDTVGSPAPLRAEDLHTKLRSQTLFIAAIMNVVEIHVMYSGYNYDL